MKKCLATILVLAVSAGVLLTAALPCLAAEKEEESVWSEDKPSFGRSRTRRPELTEERIERMMSRLKEADPEKAEELEKLRKEDPEKFGAELRRLMARRDARRTPVPRTAARRTTRGPRRPPGGRDEDLLEWFREKHPKRAGWLERLQEEDSERYGREVEHLRGRYGRIVRMRKENPELAKVLEEDLELKEERDELLGLLRLVTEEEKRAKLVEELREVVNKRFDLIVKKRRMEYEGLRKRLEELEKKVKQSEAQVQRWQDPKFKSMNVQTRVEELVSGLEEFKWE